MAVLVDGRSFLICLIRKARPLGQSLPTKELQALQPFRGVTLSLLVGGELCLVREVVLQVIRSFHERYNVRLVLLLDG